MISARNLSKIFGEVKAVAAVFVLLGAWAFSRIQVLA
jgi:hypothetical protein